MKLDIRCIHLTMDNIDLNHIREHFERSLDHFDRHILGGHIVLSDVNGPKGGIDKHCLVQLRLHGVPEIVVEEDGVDLASVTARAADRLATAVDRAIGKEKRGRRQGQEASPDGSKE